MSKLLFISIACLLAGRAGTQSTAPIALVWKIGAQETLRYQGQAQPIDDQTDRETYARQLPASLVAFIDSLQAQTKAMEQAGQPVRLESRTALATWLNREEAPHFFSRLTRRTADIVAVDLYTEKTGQEMADYKKQRDTLLRRAERSSNPGYFESVKKGLDRDTGVERVIAHGEVFATGGIASFYQPYAQKNLLALLFELPANEVRVNDSWSVDALFMTRQNFVCDSAAHQNKVTLKAIKRRRKDRIAVLEYEFSEYIAGKGFAGPVKSGYSYRAVAEFSLSTGRWIKYDGVLAFSSSGFSFFETGNYFEGRALFSFRPE